MMADARETAVPAAGGSSADKGPAGEAAPKAHRAGETPFVQIRDLRKSYIFGKIKVLNGVSDTMTRLDRLVIIGPSGGGKSTLLRCLMGLEDIDGGSIVLDGRTYIERKPNGRTAIDRAVQRQVGMVFQHYTLFPHLSSATASVGRPPSSVRKHSCCASGSPTS
jgi:ABC-type polar amino acid transport system ATPase subunit